MNRVNKIKDNKELVSFYNNLKLLYEKLGDEFLIEFDRLPAFSDLIVDRWEKANKLGFGENTNVYDNSLIIGRVIVGKECWIGPNTILDGSGGLEIGDYCTVSAGVQIYSHDNVMQTLSSKTKAIERELTIIENNVYLGPNVIIQKGVRIGHHAVIGANSFINKDVLEYAIMGGSPARKIGFVSIEDGENIKFNYQ